MIYEIINPSDAYTIKSDSKAVACLACLLVGEGQYGLQDEGGESLLPFFMFGGDPKAWFKEEFGTGLDAFIDESLEEIADCLDSILIGKIGTRQGIEAMLEVISDPVEREKAWAAWQDKKRSSMNDIGSHAKNLAKAFREKKRAPRNPTPVIMVGG